MKEYCERMGYAYEVFAEKISGAREHRTELDRMLQRIRAREFDALMVWKIDRLGRSLQHLLQILQELENRKVQFISLSEGFDTTTPQGKFFFQVVGSFAELERAMISERIKQRLAHLKSKGKKLGRPTGSKDKRQRKRFGYFRRYRNDNI